MFSVSLSIVQVSVTNALVVPSALQLSPLVVRRTSTGVVADSGPCSEPLTKWTTLSL